MKAADELLIGFDLGTSAIKAIVADSDGNLIARASRRVTFIRPEPDFCEIDPEQYFDDVIDIIQELADQSGNPGHIRGISFCAASGNTLLLDEHFDPVINTISWLDHRCFGKAEQLWPEIDAKKIYQQVGWPWSGGFPLATLAWIRDFKPEVWQKARYHTMNNDFVYYKLCGRLVVDPSKATTFYLQDQLEEAWNPELLDFLGLEESNLSEILPSGTKAGLLTREICDRTGLSEETVVATGSFDHPSAARSTGVFEEGELLLSAGTSWVTFTPIRKRETGLESGMIVDPFLAPSGCWAGMLALTAVAERIDALLIMRFGEGENLYGHFDEMAMLSSPGADGLMVDPWKQTTEEIAELTKEVSDGSYCRAIMEGCVFLLVNRIRSLERVIGSSFRRTVMVGGPTKSPVWPGILAAAIGTPLSMPESNAHAGALGAAIMAGMGAGIYRDVREGHRRIARPIPVLEPGRDDVIAYQNLYNDFVDKFKLDG